MTDERVISIPLSGTGYTGVTYSESGYIGRGELGAIYKGEADGQDVVVKIPHTLAKNTEAETELNIMTALNGALGRAEPVGVIDHGTHDDKTVIVMPYYHDRDLLLNRVRGHLRAGERLDAERLAVKSAIHYAEVMVALHNIPAPMACTDRKVKDYYLVAADHDRPAILDWNVLRPNEEGYRLTEIKLFGQLWHELFFGSKGSAPYDPFDDRKWGFEGRYPQGAISVGLRVLMAQAISANAAPDPRGAEMERLGEALKQWSALIVPADDPSAEAVHDALTAFTSPLPVINESVVEAVLYDLRWRLGLPDTSAEERTKRVEDTRLTQQTGDPVVNQIYDMLDRQSPEHALRLIQEELYPHAPTAAERLNLRRWQTIIEELDTVQEMNLRSYQRDSIRKYLFDGVGRALHSPPAEDTHESLAAVAEALAAVFTDGGLKEEQRSERLHQLHAEHDLRTTALRIRQRDDHNLNRRLARISKLTEAFDGYTNRYFSPQEDEAVTETFIRQLVDDEHLLSRLRDQIAGLEAATFDEIDKLGRELLAVADLKGHGRWLTKQIGPWLAMVEFRRDFSTHNLQLSELVERLNTLKAQLSPSDFEKFRAVIADTARPHIDSALADFNRHMTPQPGTTTLRWSEVGKKAQDIHGHLTNPVLGDYGLAPTFPADKIDVFTRVKASYDEWTANLTTFISHKTAQNLRMLMDSPKLKPQEMDMTDLLGKELLEKYRGQLETLLDEGLKEDIANFLADGNKLQNRINNAAGEMNSAQSQLLRATEQYVTTIRSKVSDELDSLKHRLDELEGERAALVQKIERGLAVDTRDQKKLSETIEVMLKEVSSAKIIKDGLGRVFDERLAQHAAFHKTLSTRTLTSSQELYDTVDDILRLADDHTTLMRDAIPVVVYDPARHARWIALLDDISRLVDTIDDNDADFLTTAEQVDVGAYIGQVREAMKPKIEAAKQLAEAKLANTAGGQPQ